MNSLLTTIKFGLSTLLILLSVQISAETLEQQKPVKGPVIKGYGPVFAIKNRSVKLLQNFKYKVVFDVLNSPDSADKLNRRIESIARFINMHAINGVKLENMDIAAVFHGHAAKDLLNNKAYQEKYLFKNPNIELIEKLRKAGVKFYICGQSVRFGGFHKEDLLHPGDLALSAMTTLVVLQQQGYQLLPN